MTITNESGKTSLRSLDKTLTETKATDDSLVSTPADEKDTQTPESVASELFSGKPDWSKVYATLSSMPEVRQVIVDTPEYLIKILACLDASSQPVIHSILDNLVELVDDDETLTLFISRRFGIDMDPASYDKNNTEVFGTNGLKEIYQVLLKLPPSHVKRLLSLTTDDTNGGDASGVTSNSERIEISYEESDVQKKEDGGYADEGDVMYGMTIFDTTLAHEMGHVADYKDRYSMDKEFLGISGWVEYKKPKKIVSTMVDNMKNPLPDSLDSDDKKAAKDAAKEIIDDEVTDDSQYASYIEEEYEDGLLDKLIGFVTGLFTKKEDKERQEKEKKEKIAQKVETIKGSTLFKHINCAFATNAPWMDECFEYLPQIQIHQGYEGGSWWSYKNGARTDSTKNSRYQFRDPGEDFAELYATYYMSTPENRAKIEPNRKDWFERTVVKDANNGK